MKALVVAALAAMPLFAAEVPVPGATLVNAIKSGQRSTAIDLIANKSVDVNVAEADGSTPLLWAAHSNDTDLVTRLLKVGARPNVRNRLGSTPLLEAAFNANTEAIKALIDAGADPKAAGADGETPLMLVARSGNVAAAKLLLDKGADPNVRETRRGQTALMWAAAASHGPTMRELLARGAQADAASDTDLMTPLVSAEPRAQPRPPGGMTAMLFSAREGCMDCVKGLVDHGAKLDLADPEGVIGERAMRALRRIGEGLGLDYAGVDFALDSEGTVLVFEANATMRIVPPPSGPLGERRRPSIDRAMAAARALLLK